LPIQAGDRLAGLLGGNPMNGISRRALLQSSLLACGGFTLPQLLELRTASAAAGAAKRSTAVIFVQLGGGPSHFETYDPKPDAPAEYRGGLSAIATSVPGVRFCELLPEQAKIADQLAIVRSVTHREASHIALHVVETGYFLRNITNALKGEMPAVGSVVSRLRGRSAGGLPAWVSLPKPNAYSGPIYLGRQNTFFDVNTDPNAADFQVNNLGLAKGLTADRLVDRKQLLASFDGSERTDAEAADALDAFQQQAIDLLTSPQARRAFDLSQEDDRLRDRYGRNAFGQRMLLARRLVEAGVPFVNVRSNDWDDHVSLIPRMQKRCPEYDRGMAALITDLADRGMARDVLVVAMGEFGRTPRVNANAGRDHWPAVASVVLAGGQYRMGQVIGASDSKGAYVVDAPTKPQSVLAMVYRHLGIDPGLTFTDFTGRPRYVLEERDLIEPLL
jgi:uncharacterized protein (DUF1501 family)